MNIEEIEKDYKSGMAKKDIITKHHITINQLNYQIKKNKWANGKGNKNAKGTKGNKGNKNARGTKGNKGGHGTKGNRNAEVTGAYSKILKECFSEDEWLMYNEEKINKKDELIEEIKILKIRETRILIKIQEIKSKNKDLTIVRMSKYITTSTEAENTLFLIERLENALTKIQEAKRRALDSLHKIELEDERFNYEKSRNDDKSPNKATERINIINDLPNDEETEVMQNE